MFCHGWMREGGRGVERFWWLGWGLAGFWDGYLFFLLGCRLHELAFRKAQDCPWRMSELFLPEFLLGLHCDDTFNFCF